MRTLFLAGHPDRFPLPDRPDTDEFAPLPHDLTLDDVVVALAHQIRPGDLLVAEFCDATGVRLAEYVPVPYPADPHSLADCPCTGCESRSGLAAWTLKDPGRTADTGWRYLCLAPSQDGEPCTIVLRNRPMAVIRADVVARARSVLPEVSTAGLLPVSVLDDAEARMRAAAQAMLTLVSATLHRQFPTAAYLVLTRPTDDGDVDAVRLDSVRDTQGGILRAFEENAHDDGLLPDPAEEFAALWGDADPRRTGDVLELIQRADQVAPDEFLVFLPPSVMRGSEANAERPPRGIPLDPAALCPRHGTGCEPDDHIEAPTVDGEAI